MEKPVTFMAVRLGGEPVKHHNLVVKNDSSMLVEGHVIRQSGKIAEFTPMYSSRDPEVVEFLESKAAGRPIMGIKIVNVSASRAKIKEMPSGREQLEELESLASLSVLTKEVKKRFEKESIFDLTRGEAQELKDILEGADGPESKGSDDGEPPETDDVK